MVWTIHYMPLHNMQCKKLVNKLKTEVFVHSLMDVHSMWQLIPFAVFLNLHNTYTNMFRRLSVQGLPVSLCSVLDVNEQLSVGLVISPTFNEQWVLYSIILSKNIICYIIVYIDVFAKIMEHLKNAKDY